MFVGLISHWVTFIAHKEAIVRENKTDYVTRFYFLDSHNKNIYYAADKDIPPYYHAEYKK